MLFEIIINATVFNLQEKIMPLSCSILFIVRVAISFNQESASHIFKIIIWKLLTRAQHTTERGTMYFQYDLHHKEQYLFKDQKL